MSGTIWLTVSQVDDQVVISVRDSGSGIPPEMLSRVFKMFTQLDRDHPQGGLGIGLALVKNLVELHGGRINVHTQVLIKVVNSSYVYRVPSRSSAIRRLNRSRI